MVPIDACLREPPLQLGARASREGQARGELDRARRLADDHHAIARISGDDRKRSRQITRIDAVRASADACVKTFERALPRIDHAATMHVPHTRLRVRTGCSAAW